MTTIAAISTILFSDKRTMVSDFSPQEMKLISRDQSPAEGRKYFFTKYLTPLILTYWYQKSDDGRSPSNTAVARLVPTPTGIRPNIAFEPSTASAGRKLNAVAGTDVSLKSEMEQVFKACPPSLWDEGPTTLDDAMMAAFGECLPDSWTPETLGHTPVIASLMRRDTGGNSSVTLNVMTKTRSAVRSQTALLNQAESNESPQIARASRKYRKMYNVISGDWIGICDRTDPDMCPACVAIYASQAADNAYNDPELT